MRNLTTVGGAGKIILNGMHWVVGRAQCNKKENKKIINQIGTIIAQTQRGL